MEPIRNLFAALFLASIGMLIHVQFLWTHVDILLASVILVIVFKTTVATVITKVFGYNIKTSLIVSHPSKHLLDKIFALSFYEFEWLYRLDFCLHKLGNSHLCSWVVPQTCISFRWSRPPIFFHLLCFLSFWTLPVNLLGGKMYFAFKVWLISWCSST